MPRRTSHPPAEERPASRKATVPCLLAILAAAGLFGGIASASSPIYLSTVSNPPFHGFMMAGNNFDDHVGYDTTSVGDMNGDGLPEFVAGAPDVDVSGANTGRAYVIFSNSTNTFPQASDVGTGFAPGFMINGINPGDRLGSMVANAGDVNGDGLGDILVGAHIPNRVYVVFGKSNNTVVNISAVANGTGGFEIVPEAVTSGLGRREEASPLGDLNGDGLDDFVISAPQSDSARGRAYVVFGRTATTDLQLSSVAAGSGGFALIGTNANDQAGLPVCGGGDVNGDGVPDILVGARGADTGAGTDAGRVYVVHGTTTPATIQLSSVVGGTGGFVIEAQAAGDLLSTCAAAGDVNGDGRDDIVVGAEMSDAAFNEGGRVYLVHGKTSTSATQLSSIAAGTGGFVVNPPEAFMHLGGILAPAGDFNGDGFSDFIIGNYRQPGTTFDAGTNLVVFGKSTTTSVNVTDIIAGTAGLSIEGEAFADAVEQVWPAGDFNGDGLPDMTLGGWLAGPADGLSQKKGRAYLATSEETPPTSAVYRECTRAGDAPWTMFSNGGCNAVSPPDARFAINYFDGTGVSNDRVTLTRSGIGIANVPGGRVPLAVNWFYENFRTGDTIGTVRLRYMDSELGALPEANLSVWTSSSLSGPWSERTVLVRETSKNQLTCAFGAPADLFFIIAAPDEVDPTAIITLAGATPTNADAVSFTVDFSESVGSSFTAADVTVNGGMSVNPVQVTGPTAGDVYTVTVTPTSPTANGIIGVTLASTGIIDVSGNTYAGGTSATYTIDNTAPTASMTRLDPGTTNLNSVRYSVDFNESVGTSFTAADVSGTGGMTLGTPIVSTNLGGDVYQVTFTPTDPNADGTIGLHVGSNVTDLAGNSFSPTTAPDNYTIDNTRPIAAVTLLNPTRTNLDVVSFSIDFNESVAPSFSLADVAAAGSVPAGLAVSGPTAGDVYTVQATPTNPNSDGLLSINLSSTGITDVAGNVFLGNSSSSYQLDNDPPGAIIELVGASPTNADSVAFRVTFDEAIASLTPAMVSVTGGMTVNLPVSVSGPFPGNLYIVTVVPTSPSSNGILGISISTAVTDIAGNAFGGASSGSYTIDNTALTVSSFTAVTSSPTNFDSILFSVTFSADVGSSFTAADLVSSGLALSGPPIVAGAGNGPYTITATLADPLADGTLLMRIVLGVQDLAANPLTGVPVASPVVIVDNTRPTVSSLAADPAVRRNGQVTSITFTMSELLNADPLVTVNSSAATFAGSASVGPLNYQYQYLYTVQSGDPEGPALIMINATDLAGNPRLTSDSSVLTIDNTPPTLTSMTSDSGMFKVEGSLSGTFLSSGDEASATLYVRDDSGAWAPAGTAAAGGTWSFTPTADGIYHAHAVLRDVAGNSSAEPGGTTTTPQETTVIFNDVANSTFTNQVTSTSTAYYFPMETNLVSEISFTSLPGAGPYPLTVSRTENPAPAFLGSANLVAERLDISAPDLGDGTFAADLLWDYELDNGLLSTDIDTAFRTDGVGLLGTMPASSDGDMISVTNITGFSKWYAGSAVADVGEWMILNDE